MHSLQMTSNNDNCEYKARFVAKGFSQVHGEDYFDTYSPITNMSSIRILLQIAVQNNFIIHHMDVKAAYLNAPLNVRFTLIRRKVFEDKTKNSVWKLKRSLYGLKQSGRTWNNTLHAYLIDENFNRSALDPCMYIRNANNENSTILLL